MTPFTQLSVLLVLIAAVSFVLTKLKLPLLLGFLLVGILLGVTQMPLLSNPETVELLSHFGVAMLLFIIGIHLAPNALKELGSRVVIIGLLQVGLTTIFGMVMMWFLGFPMQSSLLLSLGLAFSSTILVLKLLTDEREENSLFGRMTTGILLVQDIVVSVLLIVVVSVDTTNSSNIIWQLGELIGKAGLLLGLIYLISRFFLDRVFRFAAQSQELLFITALAWGCGIASLFWVAGLSIEIGALVAGVALSMSEYAPEISARLKPIRDFLLIIFFVTLGAKLEINSVLPLLVPSLIVTSFILFIKPLVVIQLMRRMGFHRQTSFKTGMAIGQVSEFTFILLAAWMSSGLISSDAASIIILAGITSIAISTFLLPKLDWLYNLFRPLLLKIPDGSAVNTKQKKFPDAMIFGYSQVGNLLSDSLKKLGLRVLVVDFDPEQIKLLEKKKIPHMFGDASDPEFLQSLPTDQIKIFISTIPHLETNRILLSYMISQNADIISILFVNQADQKVLYDAGATYVVYPHFHAVDHVSSILARFGLNQKRYQHMVASVLNHK